MKHLEEGQLSGAGSLPETNRVPRGGTIWQSLADQADQLAEAALRDVVTAEDWTSRSSARREVLRRNLGLDPWPGSPAVPCLREFGGFSGSGFRARKFGFESFPGCWSAAAIYYPEPLPERAVPGILYNCGHTGTGSYHYHPHPVLWARRGYVCLILDTIEQNDNPGEHHGFSSHLHHRRLGLGISASGLEVFHAVRALDVLAADASVDASRLGVTGVSGGGAVSFFLAALDERVRAVSSLCGLSSPRDALAHGHLIGHCDCMYPLGIEPMDTAEIAALIAPRAALFGFGRQDSLYHIGESCRIADAARRIWEVLGAGDRWRRIIADCPHGDHPDFDEATQRWFDRHLLGEERPLLERGAPEIEESVTSVFQGCPPQPNRLHLLEELLVPRGGVALPIEPAEWPQIRAEAIRRLGPFLPSDVAMRVGDGASWILKSGEALLEWPGEIEGVPVSLRVRRRCPEPQAVWLRIATGGEGWQNAQSGLSPLSGRDDVAVAVFEPRLSGWNYPGVGSAPFPAGTHFEFETRMAKAMSLLGVTPVAMHLQDLRAAVSHLRGLPEFAGLPIYLHGRGETGVAVVLAALLDESIAGVVAENLPHSFADRASLIGALRVMDIPQAAGLAAPRPVALVHPGDGNWTWPARAYRRLGCDGAFGLHGDFSSAALQVLSGER